MSEREIFEWLSTKFVQRADDRQKAMGLVYMEAETHDLAQGLHAFIVEKLTDLLK
jgi:hypothetical protein